MDSVEKVAVAIRAKVGVIWVQTVEETRVETAITEVASSLGYAVKFWSVTRGVTEGCTAENASRSGVVPTDDETRDLDAAFEKLRKLQGRVCLILRDPLKFLDNPATLRAAKELHQDLPTLPREQAKQAVVIDRCGPPPDLQGMSVVDWPLPDREVVGRVIQSFLDWAPKEACDDLKKNGQMDALIDAALGLPAEDIGAALARSLAAKGVFDADLVTAEKERIVKGSGLEWHEADPRGLTGVGGLDALKEWLHIRRKAFSHQAREYGLPTPKGILLLGVPGTGKSLVAKCIAAEWGQPLERMDVGALFSKWVGESESQLRGALRIAETTAPCILWVDEIEKAFSTGRGDAGTSQRVFGTFLTWLQERTAGVFVVATANDISRLPSEFLRAGRWDEIFFVDLPNEAERKEITKVLCKKYPHCKKVRAQTVAAISDGFTGAEIEAAIVEAMYDAFSDKGKDVTSAGLVEALLRRVPISRSLAEQVTALRKWAQTRARFATKRAATVQILSEKREIE